jgi:hypothetical protein
MLTPAHLTQTAAALAPISDPAASRARTFSPLHFYKAFRGQRDGDAVVETETAVYGLMRSSSRYGAWIRLPGDDEILSVIRSSRRDLDASSVEVLEGAMVMPGVALACNQQTLLTSNSHVPAMHLATMLAWADASGLASQTSHLPRLLTEAETAERAVTHFSVSEHAEILMAATALRCGGRPADYSLFLQECAIADPDDGAERGLAKLESMCMTAGLPLAENAGIAAPIPDHELELFAKALEADYWQRLTRDLGEVADAVTAASTLDLNLFDGFEVDPLGIVASLDVGPVYEPLDSASTEAPACWGLFGHMPGRGRESLGDYWTKENAERAAECLTTLRRGGAVVRTPRELCDHYEPVAAILRGWSLPPLQLNGAAAIAWQEVTESLTRWRETVVRTITRDGSHFEGDPAIGSELAVGAFRQAVAFRGGLWSAVKSQAAAMGLGPSSSMRARTERAATRTNSLLGNKPSSAIQR